VVVNWPLSPYHAGTLVSVGSTLKAPRGCLSMPTATTTSPLPATMALAACCVIAAPVAQALNTLMNGMPVSPSSPTSGSACATSQLPPKAQSTSCHGTPASRRASSTASAPISNALLSPNRPNGCSPTPTIATPSMSSAPQLPLGAKAKVTTSSPFASV
jgi:hypothetical protein